MTLQLTAVFENGVLRPTQPLALPEGTTVQVLLLSPASAAQPLPGQRTPAEILDEIAALPVEGSGDAFTSRDHDRVLYGEGQTP